MSQLRLPAEGEDGLDLLLDHLSHSVPAVHVDRADCHHLTRENDVCVDAQIFGDDTKTFQELSVGSELSVCVESYDEEDSEEAM